MAISAPDTPQAPSAKTSYQQGIDVLLKNLPSLLAAEDSSRLSEDPMRIAESQGLQDAFGYNQYKQQLDALHQLDPASAVIRDQLAGGVSQQVATPENQGLYAELGKSVGSDLSSGYSLPAGLRDEITNTIRGRQALTGNVRGNAPASAEAAFGASNLQNLYQQHLQNASNYLTMKSPTQTSFDNAGQFLGLPTPEQQILSVQPVTPDRTSAYVDPNAGFQGQQFALNNYQNLLARTQASGGASAWTRALGAAAGAAGGYATGGTWGAVLGGANGALNTGGGWG